MICVDLNLIKIKRRRRKPITLLRLCVTVYYTLQRKYQIINRVGKPFKRWPRVICFTSNNIKSAQASGICSFCHLSIFDDFSDKEYLDCNFTHYNISNKYIKKMTPSNKIRIRILNSMLAMIY